MKKAIKIISLILTVTLTAFCAAGCGESANEENSKDANVIIFATSAEFAPFEFVVPGNGVIEHFDGIDIAIASHIGKNLNKTVKMENMEFETLFDVLEAGKCDAVIAAISVTDERSRKVDFSISYFNSKQVMIVKKTSKIESAADLKGNSIGVIHGYIGEDVVKDLGFKPDYDYTVFNKSNEAVLELINGKCDVIVIDSAAARELIADNEELKIVEDDEAFKNEHYAIAVKKGNKDLLDKINKSIEKMLTDGTIDELYKKYAS